MIGFSDKVELGSYRTDYEGKISEVIDVSKLPVGKHMLILEGVTFSGETVRYYQFLDVFNPRKEDISTNEPVGRSEEKNLGSNAATHYSTQSVLGLKDTYPLGSQNSTSVNTQENPGIGGNESTHSSKEVSGVSVDLSWKTSFFFSSSVLLVGGVLYAFKRQRKQN